MNKLFVSSCLLVSILMSACDSAQNESSSDLQADSSTSTAEPQEATALADKPSAEKIKSQQIKSALLGSQFEASSAPAAIAYRRSLQQALASERPVLALENLSDPKADLAQRLVLDYPQLTQTLFEPTSSKALRSEVMSVAPALPGDRVDAAEVCQPGQCYRVDIYNFFFNTTVTGIVDVQNKQVLVMSSLPESQPDLSPRLEALAEAIAKHEPLVQAEVERYLKSSNAEDKEVAPVMVSTKSALKYSLCERSQHLCVAPTYVLGSQALWVIVDLTDLRVAGVRWTNVGSDDNTGAPPQIITERKLENEYVYQNFCERTTELKRNGWSLDYHLTSSDGLRIANAKFNNDAVFDSAKVVDWHVSYSLSDGFGYSDATGCPMFSSAVVVAYDGPAIEAIMDGDQQVGFSIAQDFRQLPWPAPCNYRYEERYEFYNDGRYRVALSNHGRGCGINGTYRPVLRMQFGQPQTSNGYRVEQWDADNWSLLEQEQWSQQPPKESLSEQKFSHRLLNSSGEGYMLAPSTGDFGDGGRGDNAFIYTTVKHPEKDEGDRDLVTLGSCCNKDYRQGPEQFMDPPEPLLDETLVLWYVPQIKNDGRDGQRYCWAQGQVVDGTLKIKTWPCTAGPMFVPTNLSTVSESNDQ